MNAFVAPSAAALASTAERLKAARINAKPLTVEEVAALEANWTRDGIHHHMGSTSTIHRLLATIASQQK